MNRTRAIFLLITLLTCNKIYAGRPNNVKEFINHSDWNFVENKGQLTSSEIKYYGHQGGVYLYCKPGTISFVFTKTDKENTKEISEATSQPVETQCLRLPHASAMHPQKDAFNASLQRQIKTSRADLILLNSNPSAQILASDQQEYYENFYTTGNADSGITNVHTYKTITYKSIYPNIDLVLYAKEKGMKYEFVVYPGGKVSDIQMQWNGLENTQMTENGGIEYAVALGKMEESKPVCFQGKNLIESDFSKHSSVIGFKVNRYDKGKVLVIDPTLVWGTYFGGSGDEEGIGVATSKSGNVYITGYTTGTDHIATSGAYQTTMETNYSINFDAFLAKFNSGGQIIWSTYYGGELVDVGYAVAADDSDNTYITGITGSRYNIANSNSYLKNPTGSFLAKFNKNGMKDWGTYCDGTGGIAVDVYANIYLTGQTSIKGLATSGVYQTSLIGNTNAFLAKFNNKGQRLWDTYYGESIVAGGNAVALDGFGNIFITGFTSSANNIATTGAYQTSLNGASDAYLANFDSLGRINWATYYGGNGSEGSGSGYTTGIAIDHHGNIYISGSTTSTTEIATTGAFQTSSQGNDAYLAKFSGSGKIQWATFYGGDFSTSGSGIATDIANNIYLAGSTTCSSGISTNNGFQSRLAGGENAFIAEFNEGGARQWATYYGGRNSDGAYGIAANNSGDIYLTGYASSTTGIATSGTYQSFLYGGAHDAFLIKFYNSLVVNDAGIDSIISPRGNYCNDTLPVIVNLKNSGHNELDSVKIILSVNGKIQPAFSWTGKIQPDSILKVSLGNVVFSLGADTLKIWTYNPNGGLDSFPGNDTATTIFNCYPLPSANAGPDTILCYNESYTMQGSGGITYFWHPATYLSSATDPKAIAILPNTERYILVVTNTHGCQDSSPVLLKVRPKLRVKIISDTQACYGTNLLLSAITGGGDSLHYHFSWTYDNNFSRDSLKEIASTSGWHKVILSDNCSAVQATDSFYIKVIAPAKAAFMWSPDSPLIREPVTFLNQSVNTSSFLWDFGNKDTSRKVSPVINYYENGEYKVKLIAYGLSHCPNDTAFGIVNVIDLLVTIYIPNAFSPNGDGINDVFDISGVGIKSYTYNIYNRWGEHLFEATPGHTAWDGTFKGEQVPESIYIYQLDVTDIEGHHHYLSGNISLIR